MPIELEPGYQANWLNTGFKESWDENTTRSRLQDIANATCYDFIHTNLTVSKNVGWGNRCFFSIVGRHFDCLLSLYFINPARSASLLSQLGTVIVERRNPELYAIFTKAVNNFTFITNHAVAYPEWNVGPTSNISPISNIDPISQRTSNFVVVTDPASACAPDYVEAPQVHHHYSVSPVPVPVVLARPVSVVVPVPRSVVPPRHFHPVSPAGHVVPGQGRREVVRNPAPSPVHRVVPVRTGQPTSPTGNVIPGQGCREVVRNPAAAPAHRAVPTHTAQQGTPVARSPAPRTGQPTSPTGNVIPGAGRREGVRRKP